MSRVNPRSLKLQPALDYEPKTSTLPIDAIDHLTNRWLGSLPSDCKGTVFSTVGVWPLLAILADVANPGIRAQLEEALGMTLPDPSKGADSGDTTFTNMAQDVIHALDNSEGTTAALGLWFARELDVREEWIAAVPSATVQILPKKLEARARAITKWANEKTHGMIPNLYIQPDESAVFVLASALTLRTTWETAFTRYWWKDHLMRTTREEGTVRTSPEVTTVCIRGGGAAKGEESEPGTSGGQHDVYLVLGEETASAGTVLAKGLEAIRGRGETKILTKQTAEEMAKAKTLGPGIRVHTTHEARPKNPLPFVHVNVPSFDIRHETNLFTKEFGLPPLPGTTDFDNQYPGIASNLPVIVTGALQIARAGFHEKGFEASAFSVIMGKGGAGPPRGALRVLNITATFDRPFGFLAVERESGLLLFAGWTTEDDWTPVKADPPVIGQKRPHEGD